MAREWIAVVRCGRCDHPIRTVRLGVSEDGKFELGALPKRCTEPSCQAGFDVATNHALEVTLYRSGRTD